MLTPWLGSGRYGGEHRRVYEIAQTHRYDSEQTTNLSVQHADYEPTHRLASLSTAAAMTWANLPARRPGTNLVAAMWPAVRPFAI